MSSRPCRFNACATTASACPGSRTSARNDDPPVRLATSANSSRSNPTPTTTTPRAASASAVALPMPRPAPVTTATVPVSSTSAGERLLRQRLAEIERKTGRLLRRAHHVVERLQERLHIVGGENQRRNQLDDRHV